VEPGERRHLGQCCGITPEQRQDVSDELEKARTATETPAEAMTTGVVLL
jgi:hypothetical protein